MKKLKTTMGMLAIAISLMMVTSCKDTKKSDEHMEMNQDDTNHDGGMNMDMDHAEMQNDEMMDGDHKTSQATGIINGYIGLKNALVADNSEAAATLGKTLLEALETFDQSTIVEAQQKEVNNIIQDSKEHAEHISENSGKIDHQRGHFELLTKDINDLVAITGTDRVLYKTYCPMYNEGKGGIWLSEIKEIKNPYLGSKMLNCGKIQEEIK